MHYIERAFGHGEGAPTSPSLAPRDAPLADNRRLDEWVAATRVKPLDDDDDAPGGGRKSSHKRRFEEVHVEDHHAGLDPATAALEREREEITKVKNIPRIELGRYEMDSWYYSPYPDEYAGENLKGERRCHVPSPLHGSLTPRLPPPPLLPQKTSSSSASSASST